MAVLDFTPAPGAAAPAQRVLRHGLTEAKLLVRNGEQLLLALVIPLAVLLGGRLIDRLDDISVLAPSVLALAVWSTGFTSVAIATGFERRYGVLERLAATPLGKTGLLLGKALAVTMIIIGQLVVLAAVAAAVGWRPQLTLSSVLAAAALIIMASATFVSLALLLAGRLRAEVTLGLANLIYVILLLGGGLVIPAHRYPAVVRPLVEALPTGALGEGLRAAATGSVLGWPFLVLLLWLLVAGLCARKGFRWTS
jgi:ABC-2 type transport system permease protein